MNSLSICLIINSILIIGLILNQNESAKDTLNNSRNTDTKASNPLENFTWVSLCLEFSLFLLQSKETSF